MKGRRGIAICLRYMFEGRSRSDVRREGYESIPMPHSALIPEEESHGR